MTVISAYFNRRIQDYIIETERDSEGLGRREKERYIYEIVVKIHIIYKIMYTNREIYINWAKVCVNRVLGEGGGSAQIAAPFVWLEKIIFIGAANGLRRMSVKSNYIKLRLRNRVPRKTLKNRVWRQIVSEEWVKCTWFKEDVQSLPDLHWNH